MKPKRRAPITSASIRNPMPIYRLSAASVILLVSILALWASFSSYEVAPPPVYRGIAAWGFPVPFLVKFEDWTAGTLDPRYKFNILLLLFDLFLGLVVAYFAAITCDWCFLKPARRRQYASVRLPPRWQVRALALGGERKVHAQS